MTQRWELLRALGAVADSPAAARAVADPLGLAPVSDAEHTEVFVLNCPPYASVYLGPDGALGGEGADRAAGFWRALAITPPAEPDHLTALLALYASLGEAAAQAGQPATARALARSRLSLFREHLWPWLPAYLDAVADLGVPTLTAWAGLTRRAGPERHHPDPPPPRGRRGRGRAGPPDRRAALCPPRHVRPGSAGHHGLGRGRGGTLAAPAHEPGRHGRGGRLVGGPGRPHRHSPAGTLRGLITRARRRRAPQTPPVRDH
jgi:TorA maturation chaperone TorD